MARPIPTGRASRGSVHAWHVEHPSKGPSYMPNETAKPKPPVESGKLTRRFLMSLTDGHYLVSNCYDHLGPGEYVPCFAEEVAQLAEREAQWRRIKDAHADSRNCNLFVDEAHFAAWRQTIQGAPCTQG